MEMLVALSALTIGLLGIVTLLNFSLGLNRTVADNYRATYLAAEGIEIVKSLVITNNAGAATGDPLATRTWCSGLPAGDYELDYRAKAPPPSITQGFSCGSPYDNADPAFVSIAGSSTSNLFFHPDTHLYGLDQTGGEKTPFTRTVTISYKTPESTGIADDQMVVQSVVEWRDRSGYNQVELVDYLFNPASSLPPTP